MPASIERIPLNLSNMQTWKFWIVLGGWVLAMSISLKAQDTLTGKPNQNNILKLNISALAQNKAMLLFEKELQHTTSLEFGAGFIYPNKFWAGAVGPQFLGSGFTVSAGFRKYFDKAYYSVPPKFRSYLSPQLYYSHSGFENQWFVLPHPNPALSECQLDSRTFDQYGMRLILGFQTTQGRLVLDMYAGLGFKLIQTTYQLHAVTPGEECMITDSTIFFTDPPSKFMDNSVTVHAGIKLGYRFGKHKEYPRKFDSDIPQFDIGRRREERNRFITQF